MKKIFVGLSVISVSALAVIYTYGIVDKELLGSQQKKMGQIVDLLSKDNQPLVFNKTLSKMDSLEIVISSKNFKNQVAELEMNSGVFNPDSIPSLDYDEQNKPVYNQAALELFKQGSGIVSHPIKASTGDGGKNSAEDVLSFRVVGVNPQDPWNEFNPEYIGTYKASRSLVIKPRKLNSTESLSISVEPQSSESTRMGMSLRQVKSVQNGEVATSLKQIDESPMGLIYSWLLINKGGVTNINSAHERPPFDQIANNFRGSGKNRIVYSNKPVNVHGALNIVIPNQKFESSMTLRIQQPSKKETITIVSDSCLSYSDNKGDRWVCEDSCLETQGSQLCGKTDHL